MFNNPPFLIKMAGPCSLCDVIAPWPDMTQSIFYQKLCGCPRGHWNFWHVPTNSSARIAKKLMGVASTLSTLPGRGLTCVWLLWGGGAFYSPIPFFLNLRHAGGVRTPPCGFSQISQKQRRGLQPFLEHLFMPLFRTLISDPGSSKSGHKVTSSDLTSEKVRMLVIATPTEQSPWNF